MVTKKTLAAVSASAVLIAVSFACGYYARDEFFKKPAYRTSPLTLPGFSFTKPLLICDTSSERSFPELKPLQSQLNSFINDQEKAKNINIASVYFQDLKTGGRIDINSDEKFSPASLAKVPIMIATLKEAEDNPSLLPTQISYHGEDDYNKGQEIQPKDYAKAGGVYTVEDLIEKMIEHSDNNSFAVLENLLGDEKLKSFFSDLQVPFPVNSNNPQQFNSMTTKDVSYFFRVLYNSTYINDNLSELALEILNQTDYNNGIVAGVPATLKVSHKFGLQTIFDSTGKIQSRELSDCGIVYYPNHPYLICVMTKTPSSIQAAADVIKNISSMVYSQVAGYAK